MTGRASSLLMSVGDGIMTGALHVLVFQLLTLPGDFLVFFLNFILSLLLACHSLQCFDTVGWGTATGRASGL